MPIIDVPTGIAIPDIGKFPLDADSIFALRFASLDAIEIPSIPEAPQKGESRKSAAMRAQRKAARDAAKEQRKAARAAAKEKIKAALKNKVKELTAKSEEVGKATATIAGLTPALLGIKAWLVTYDALYIEPLQKQMEALAAVSAGTPAGPAAVPTAAALTVQIAEAKDGYEQMKKTYDAQVAQLKAAAEVVNNNLAFIAATLGALQLVGVPAVAAFMAAFPAILAAVNATVALLD